MRILYIGDRNAGGIQNHLQCLRECLPRKVVTYAIGMDESFAGKSGHDWRELGQIRRVIREFKPDLVHFHTSPLLMALYVRFVARLPRVCSIHTPSCLKLEFSRWLVNWAVMPCYFLPVSGSNWKNFKTRYPHAQGEVFFNPVMIRNLERRSLTPNSNSTPIVGMVGRNAKVKDWPMFHAVVDRVKGNEKLGGGGRRNIKVLNAGEDGFCDGRAAIAQMDLFLLTSISEEMPTTVLECFRSRTPICGFIPLGGMQDTVDAALEHVRQVTGEGLVVCAYERAKELREGEDVVK